MCNFQWRKHPLEHQLRDAPFVSRRETFGQPVRTTVAVGPLRSRFENLFGAAARLLETCCLYCQVCDRDPLNPAGFVVRLRWDRQCRMMLDNIYLPDRFFHLPQPAPVWYS